MLLIGWLHERNKNRGDGYPPKEPSYIYILQWIGTPVCYFPRMISMSYIKKDLGVEYDAPPSNKGKIEYHQGLLDVPFKHLKSRWIIILEANPPKRDLNLAGSRKFLALIVLTLEKSTSLEGVSAVTKWWFSIVMLHPWRLTAGTCPHGGLVQIIFLSKWVICRFQPLIFQGVVHWREILLFTPP